MGDRRRENGGKREKDVVGDREWEKEQENMSAREGE